MSVVEVLRQILAALRSSGTARSITESESDGLKNIRAIYVGTGGDLICDFGSVTEVAFANVPDGTTLPISPTRIRSASTASDLVALY